jgi:hypothetical protein
MKSVEYRRLAEQSLAMVELVSSEEAKNTLFSIAQCWHRLAQEAEEFERGDVVSVENPAPALTR